jgi:hypothetical protein
MPSNEHDHEHRPLLHRSREDSVFDSVEYSVPIQQPCCHLHHHVDHVDDDEPKNAKDDNGNGVRRTWKEFLNIIIPLFILIITEAPRGIFMPTLVVFVNKVCKCCFFMSLCIVHCMYCMYCFVSRVVMGGY